MRLISPSKILLPYVNSEVIAALTYTNKSIGFQLSKLKKNRGWRTSNPEAYDRRIAELTKQQKPSLVFSNEDGTFWTYSGFTEKLNKQFGWTLKNEVVVEPPPRAIPWKKIPFKMRSYQSEAVEALLAANHGAVELPTGSGKTLIILNLLRKYPVKTVVMTPSTKVTRQIYQAAVEAFGQKNVGMFGDGRKNCKKLFTIANGQSLVNVKENSEAWELLKKTKMIIADESHCIPANTFEKVCMTVLGEASRRFFISATQTRTDGSELKLSGITGPIVYKKSFKELVAGGFLKEPIVKIFKVPAVGSNNSDPNTETRKQLYNNSKVNKLAADIAEKAVRMYDRQVVIMIEEYEQFMNLYYQMKVPFDFIHGAVSEENKRVIPEEYWKSKDEEVFEKFNNGETSCIIGTSAMGVGVDLKPVGCIIYLQGGTSEIKVKQSIGRGTRPVGPKDLWVVDFMVTSSPILERHSKERQKIYTEISDNIIVYEKVYAG